MVSSFGTRGRHCEVYEQGVRIGNDGEYRAERRYILSSIALTKIVWMRLSPSPSFQLTNLNFYDVNFLVILAITIVVLGQLCRERIG